MSGYLELEGKRAVTGGIWSRPFAPDRKPESPQFGVIRSPRGTI